jgi:hypothetical protein
LSLEENKFVMAEPHPISLFISAVPGIRGVNAIIKEVMK